MALTVFHTNITIGNNTAMNIVDGFLRFYDLPQDKFVRWEQKQKQTDWTFRFFVREVGTNQTGKHNVAEIQQVDKKLILTATNDSILTPYPSIKSNRHYNYFVQLDGCSCGYASSMFIIYAICKVMDGFKINELPIPVPNFYPMWADKSDYALVYLQMSFYAWNFAMYVKYNFNQDVVESRLLVNSDRFLYAIGKPRNVLPYPFSNHADVKIIMQMDSSGFKSLSLATREFLLHLVSYWILYEPDMMQRSIDLMAMEELIYNEYRKVVPRLKNNLIVADCDTEWSAIQYAELMLEGSSDELKTHSCVLFPPEKPTQTQQLKCKNQPQRSVSSLIRNELTPFPVEVLAFGDKDICREYDIEKESKKASDYVRDLFLWKYGFQQSSAFFYFHTFVRLRALTAAIRKAPAVLKPVEERIGLKCSRCRQWAINKSLALIPTSIQTGFQPAQLPSICCAHLMTP